MDWKPPPDSSISVSVTPSAVNFANPSSSSSSSSSSTTTPPINPAKQPRLRRSPSVSMDNVKGVTGSGAATTEFCPLVSRYANRRPGTATTTTTTTTTATVQMVERSLSGGGRFGGARSPDVKAMEVLKGFNAALQYEGGTDRGGDVMTKTFTAAVASSASSTPVVTGARSPVPAFPSSPTSRAHKSPVASPTPFFFGSDAGSGAPASSHPPYSATTSPSLAFFSKSTMAPHQFTHQHPSRSEVSLASSTDFDTVATSQSTAAGPSSQPQKESRKGKSKGGFVRLGRSRSKHDKDPKNNEIPSRSATSTPVQDDRSVSNNNLAANNPYGGQSGKDSNMVGGSRSRNRSHDRYRDDGSHSDYPRPSTSQQNYNTAPSKPDKPEKHYRYKEPKEPKDKDKDRSMHPRGENSGLFSSLKSSGTRVGEMIGKGLFGKTTRQNSTTEREPAISDEDYIIKIINLPLVEQTRMTRISKRLEESRDKTEFWMPAFPWRAIDYLNYKGCDVEGLYRVPGSGPQIKKWQRRFDEEFDVDLFEQDDLYDINIIGSMLKAWLRELPDELFPKAAQDRISRECAGAEEVPQMLIDELSNLSPFNYYLLFAITCHLSLLLAHADKNKMDYRNLCICFQPCMKIDAFCFKFLVCNWRECWKGCASEAQYIEEEYRLFDAPPPRGLTRTGGVIPTSPKPTAITSSTSITSQSGAGAGANPQPIQIIQKSPKADNKSSPLHPPADIHSTTDDGTSDRAVSSSGSSKQSSTGTTLEPGHVAPGKIRTRRGTALAPIDASPGSVRSISTTLTSDTEHEGHHAGEQSQGGKRPSTPAREIRPLSPIKPLSPLDF